MIIETKLIQYISYFISKYNIQNTLVIIDTRLYELIY